MNAPLLKAMLAEDSEIVDQATPPSNRLEDNWDEPPLPYGMGLGVAQEELQGVWYSLAGRRDVEFLVTGNHFTVRFADGDIYMGAFELNPTASPRTMDMRIDDGPARHKGKTALCIYEFNGTVLRWCAAPPGSLGRLTVFPAVDDPRSLCLLFRREVPVTAKM